MVKTLNRYIIRHSLKAIAVTFMVIIGIIMLVDFVENARNLDSDVDISTLGLLYLTLLKAPKLIEQTLPFIVLFGIMSALFGMNRRSELIVMRAAGLSAWKFLQPALCVVGALGILWSGLINPIASKLSNHHNQLIETWTTGTPIETDKQIWLRDGTETLQTVILAHKINLSKRKLFDATFYLMDVEADNTTKFQRRYDAKTAILVTDGFWQLHGVSENVARRPAKIHDTISLPTGITLSDLRKQVTQVSSPSFWKIPSQIAANEAAGYSSRGLRLEFHRLLALPISLIAMTFIAAAVSMHLTRESGTIRLLITGAAIGFVVYFTDNVIHAFGGSAIIPVILASWAMPLFTLFFGISYLTRIEDG